MKTSPIKIAGQGCDWTEESALLFKNKLCEVGFCARIMNLEDQYYVIYSYRNFTSEEATVAIKSIKTCGEKHDEKF